MQLCQCQQRNIWKIVRETKQRICCCNWNDSQLNYSSLDCNLDSRQIRPNSIMSCADCTNPGSYFDSTQKPAGSVIKIKTDKGSVEVYSVGSGKKYFVIFPGNNQTYIILTYWIGTEWNDIVLLIASHKIVR